VGGTAGVHYSVTPASSYSANKLEDMAERYGLDLENHQDRRFVRTIHRNMAGTLVMGAGLMGHGAGRIVGGVLGGGAAVAGEGIARGARAIRAKIAAARAARAARAAEGLES